MPSNTQNKPDTLLTRASKESTVHPIWKTIHVAVVMGIVTTFLWANASNFDTTEFRSITGILIVLIIYAFGGDALKLLRRNKD